MEDKKAKLEICPIQRCFALKKSLARFFLALFNLLRLRGAGSAVTLGSEPPPRRLECIGAGLLARPSCRMTLVTDFAEGGLHRRGFGVWGTRNGFCTTGLAQQTWRNQDLASPKPFGRYYDPQLNTTTSTRIEVPQATYFQYLLICKIIDHN